MTNNTTATNSWLNKIAKEKTALLQEMFGMEPIHVDEVKDPITKKLKARCQGEDVVEIWDKIYGNDPVLKSIVVETVTGPSTPNKDYYDDIHTANPAMPYQQIRAVVGDGGRWKWPEIWKKLDLLPRRGPAWRHIDDPSNLGKIENPNPHITPLNCLVVGGGPVGLRLAIELVLGGHRVTVYEKRRENIVDKAESESGGKFESVGFTNRVNRPHINNFCRNDLDRLNGRNFMSPKACYPVFTNDQTSSIGIDESQMLLLKTSLLLGVNFELGVGYVDADVDIENLQNQRPSWMVTYTADETAQKRYNKQPEGQQRFDALFGCDGTQSKVRQTQSEWLGKPKTRQYKRMFGVVSNLRKVSKKKLKELGYNDGLEPDDRAGGNTGIFFYKASYHNYFIVHPSAEEMAANNIPWKGVFGFHKAREQVNKEKSAHKEILRKYMIKKATELNIPIDVTLPNQGFVEAPNDVMGFDFSEFYNCEKAAAFYGPPIDWDIQKDGEWEIHCPLIALAGDSVSDPNWLLGVGLQRGWNSAMDAAFYADNVYNNKHFNGKPPNKYEPITEPVEWSQHLDNVMNLMENNANFCRESRLSDEMDTGMLNERGPVVLQIQKAISTRNIDAPVPQYLPPVEPWFRYKEYELSVNRNYKGRDLIENKHPLATREVAIFLHNERWVDRGAWLRKTVTRPNKAMLTWPKRFECSAFWGMMKLLEIDGRRVTDEKGTENKQALGGEPAPSLSPEGSPLPKLNASEVMQKANRKSNRLRENIVMAAMAGPSPAGVDRKDRSGLDAIIFQAASKGKALSSEPQSFDEKQQKAISSKDVSSESKPAPMTPSSVSSTLHMAITSIPEKQSRALQVLDGDPLHEARLHTMRCEREILQARLKFSQLELAKVQAEETAVKAKLLYSMKEIEMIQSSLDAYDNAEVSLKAMMVPSRTK